MKKKLFILDAYAIIFRAYYAFISNKRIDSKGRNISAIFGFAMILEDIIEKGNPDYIVVAFDTPGGSFRKELYNDYKATRSATPDDIIFATPYIKELIDIYNIPSVCCPNYEADDIIATIAINAEKEGLESYIVSSDKDFGQLVTDNIKIYKPKNKGGGYTTLGIKEVCENFEIDTPSQVIDYLALVGDKVDNIPGVKGIGDKTASKLLKEYGSIEEIINNISEMKGSMKVNFENSIDSLRLSYKLATIETKVPIDVDIEKYKLKPIKIKNLKNFFEEFEIRSLLDRVIENNKKRFPFDNQEYQDESEDDEKKSILTELKEVEKEVKSLENKDILVEFIDRFSIAKEINISIKALDEDSIYSKITTLSISLDKDDVFYTLSFSDIVKSTYILNQIKNVFENTNTIKVGYDIKQLKHLLNNHDISLNGDYFDVMIAHYILESDLSHELDVLSEKYLRCKMSFYDKDKKKKKKEKNLIQQNLFQNEELLRKQIDEVVEVNYLLPKLKSIFQQNIHKEDLNELFYDIEMPLINVLFDMEKIGVRLDVGEINKQEKFFEDKLKTIEEEIYKFADTKFNINSPMQVGEILFDKMKLLDDAVKTKTGKYKTSEEELLKIKDEHPIIKKILEHRSLKKLVSTYLKPLPSLMYSDGRLHPKYNQAIASTGRLSSSEPNIQNIPIKTEDGRVIRSAFVPSDGNVFISADYSQIELRLMAEVSGDTNLVEAFSNGYDVHKDTASKIFNVPIDFVTPDQRRMAKTVNFGLIYGMSIFGLKESLEISFSEAKRLIEEYFQTYPMVEKYMKDIVLLAKRDGYVTTLTKRRRYLKDINASNNVVRSYAERNAINAPLQGSAADIIKKAMVDIYNEFNKRGLKSKMIIQVHDELNFDVLPEEKDIVINIIREKMEHVMPFIKTPLVVDIGIGCSWLEAH